MRIRFAVAVLSLASVLGADVAYAQQQSVHFSLGYFTVRGEDARVEGDALVVNREIYLFDFKDFNGPSVGADYLVGFGDYFEAGVGIGYTSRAVDTIYDERFDRREIEQQLKLRVVPMTATLRILPLGHTTPVQPYVGGGIGLYNWRYSETGDFIDFTLPDHPIFRESYVASGTSFGPVAVFGLRFPVGNATIGGEVRYQRAEGDLDERDFLGPKIDLGGLHYSATVGFRW